MQKEIFVCPNPEACKSVVSTLFELGVSEDKIGVIAKDGLPIDELPEADEEDKNDAVAGAKRGAVLGSAVGLFAGLGVISVAPVGIIVGGAGLAVAALGGATYGTLVSAMIGSSVPNSLLREYQDQIESGAVVVIVEMDEANVDNIKKAVIDKHPELSTEGKLGPVPPVI